MNSDKKHLKKLNEEWQKFYKSHRLRWLTKLHPSALHFLKTITFTYIDYHLIHNGMIFEDYYFRVYNVSFNAEKINEDYPEGIEKLDLTIGSIDSDVGYGDNFWLYDGDYEYLDSAEGFIRYDGTFITEALNLHETTEIELQDILEEFDLLRKVQTICNEIEKEKDNKIAEEIKEKFGEMVKNVIKNRDYYLIEFTNGITIKGDITILLNQLV